VTAKWIEMLTGSLEQKKQYRRDMARIDALPEPHRASAKALHRYLLASGAVGDGEHIVQMVADFADLWERAAADGTPVRTIVGDDPVEFIETFAAAYEGRHWIDRERDRLRAALRDAEEGRPT